MNGSQDINSEVGRTLEERRRPLAEALTERHYELHPDLVRRYGERGRSKCLKDAEYHLSYLADAVASASPALFTDYVGWARVMLSARGIPTDDLADNLATLAETLQRELPGDPGRLASEYVEVGLRSLGREPQDEEVCLADPLFELGQRYLRALLDGQRHVASQLIRRAVEGGTSIRDIYLQVFQRSQHEIGRLWQTNQLSVAQEHYCTAATQLIMSQLYPYIFASEKNGRALVATCVSGDLHEIGVRMVSDFFEMEGWDTFYLGANTPKPDLLRTLEQRRADVLAVSATMTFHVRAVADLIEAVHAEHGDRVKVLVGGYPFNIAPDLWRRVGADGSAADALEAVALAGRLVAGG
jgi:MerR family transcriptional regulator, light-induced transcriptional regulator